MKKYLVAALVACATSNVYAYSIFYHQTQCEKITEHFDEFVRCMDNKVKTDPDLSELPAARSYMATAKNLSARVDRKQLYEDEAVLALQNKYDEINNKFQTENKPPENKLKKFIQESFGHPRQVNQQQIIINNN